MTLSMLAQKRSKAMVLVVTLIISAIIALFIISTVKLLPVMGWSATNMQEEEIALSAARSGLDYARSRIQADPAWRGDNGSGLVVDTPEFKVLEDNGNIFGFLTPADGPKSFFRLRFNFQNGTDAPEDDLPEPNFPVASEYVSYNNLKASYGRVEYRAAPDSDGGWKVTDTSPSSGAEIPRFTASIIVEGFAGPAVEDLSPTAPNFPANGKKFNREVVQIYLVRPGFLSVDSAVMAASNLDTDLNNGGSLTIESGETSAPPRIRSLNAINVDSPSHNANFNMDASGEVIVNLGEDFTLNNSPATSTNQSQAEQGPHWLKLSFDEISKAQSSDANVRAGTYVWKAGLPPRLEYFPQDFDGTNIPSGSGEVVTNSTILSSGVGAVSLNPANLEMTISDNIYVQPEGGATGFAVVSEPGLLGVVRKRPQTSLIPASGVESLIVSNDNGSVYFEGRVEGQGAVTSAEDITFQGSSVLEADPDSSVAMYAKGDINLEAIPDEIVAEIDVVGTASTYRRHHHYSRRHRRGHHGHRGYHGRHGRHHGSSGGPREPEIPFDSARDVSFSGVIYAQGNFNVNLEPVDQSGTVLGGQTGSLYLLGLLATFGGDPAVDAAPGEDPTKGQVSLRVKDAAFVYAPEYLAALSDIDVPSRLEQTLWTRL